MGNYCVYMHVSTINGKKYIGITRQNPLKRWKNGFGYCHNKYFMSAINKYGWNSFTHIILFTGLDSKTASDIEEKLIAKYQSNNREFGYNLSSGGEKPAKGHTCVHTEETKRKMSDAHKGKCLSDATKRKISNAKKWRGNGKDGLLGKDCGQARLIYQLTLDGEIVGDFYGSGEAARKLGYSSPSKIGDVCRGTRKTAYGYKWKYAEV